MKKFLLCLVTAITVVSCTTTDGKLRVKMNMKGMGDTVVVVSMADQENMQTFTGKQGVFDFEVDVPQVTILYLVEPGALRGERSAQQYAIPAMPGEEAVLTSENDGRYDVEGSKFYAQYHEADLVIEEAQKSGDQDKITKAVMDFIKAHPDYEASAVVVTMLPDVEQMKAAVALLSPEVREGRAKPLYKDVMDMAEKRQKEESEAAMKQASGLEAPDFTLNDINGKPLALSSLRGKYVIIDFWGSWCGWCIKGFPEMKKYYKWYKGKFEILGVDCNDTEEKWKEAVKSYELPWLHVYNPRSSQVLSDYGIQGFPTKIVVDPDGKIVKTIVGEDPAFYALLDDLFGK